MGNQKTLTFATFENRGVLKSRFVATLKLDPNKLFSKTKQESNKTKQQQNNTKI